MISALSHKFKDNEICMKTNIQDFDVFFIKVSNLQLQFLAYKIYAA